MYFLIKQFGFYKRTIFKYLYNNFKTLIKNNNTKSNGQLIKSS